MQPKNTSSSEKRERESWPSLLSLLRPSCTSPSLTPLPCCCA